MSEWIKNYGTLPQIGPKKQVEVKFRSGLSDEGSCWRFCWTVDNSPGDILEYRVIDEDIQETWFLIRQGSVINIYRSYERALDEAKKRARGDHGIKWTIAKLKAEAIVDALEPPVQVTKYTMRGVTKEFE